MKPSSALTAVKTMRIKRAIVEFDKNGVPHFKEVEWERK
jgi:hypothetical protein